MEVSVYPSTPAEQCLSETEAPLQGCAESRLWEGQQWCSLLREVGFNPAFSYREQLPGAVMVHGRYPAWLCLCSGNALVPAMVPVRLNRSMPVLLADHSPDSAVSKSDRCQNKPEVSAADFSHAEKSVWARALC